MSSGCDGQSVRRSLKTGIMYRRTGSAYRAAVNPAWLGASEGTIVFTIWGGMSIDMVARSA